MTPATKVDLPVKGEKVARLQLIEGGRVRVTLPVVWGHPSVDVFRMQEAVDALARTQRRIDAALAELAGEPRVDRLADALRRSTAILSEHGDADGVEDAGVMFAAERFGVDGVQFAAVVRNMAREHSEDVESMARDDVEALLRGMYAAAFLAGCEVAKEQAWANQDVGV